MKTSSSEEKKQENIKNTRKKKVYKKITHIIPFTGENQKWNVWSEKCMARSGIKG